MWQAVRKVWLKEMSQRKKYFFVSLLAIGISAAAILFVPMVSEFREQNIMWPTYAVAFAFWIGLLVCYGIQVAVFQKEKNPGKRKLPAVVRFFSNRYALVADIMLLLSFVIVILMNRFAVQGVIAFLFIAVFYLSFHMHCLLNGANYRTCIHS